MTAFDWSLRTLGLAPRPTAVREPSTRHGARTPSPGDPVSLRTRPALPVVTVRAPGVWHTADHG